MNFVALIGAVKSVEQVKDSKVLNILVAVNPSKVEIDGDDKKMWEYIKVRYIPNTHNNGDEQPKADDIVGIKGYLTEEGIVESERFQIF